MAAQRSSLDRQLSVHQLKVGLEGMKLPVWRRLVVPSDITLGSLHVVIQEAFGWQDMHLHAFEDRLGGRYAPPEDLDVPVFDEEEAVLADVPPRTGDRMDYTYDFGDDWLHRITVEGARPAEEGEGEVPLCMGGRRAMPPAEDLGGVRELTERLERYGDGQRPSPAVVRHGGEKRVEYQSPHDEVLAGLYEEGLDQADLDPAELTRGLAQVGLRRTEKGPNGFCRRVVAGEGRAGTRPKRRGRWGERQAPPGMCWRECGELYSLLGDAGLLADGDDGGSAARAISSVGEGEEERSAVAAAATEPALGFRALGGPLGELAPLRELTEKAPPLVFLMLLAAYGLPDEEWLDVADFGTDGLSGLPEGPARQLVSALLADQYHDPAGTLELFGAAERDGHEPPADDAVFTLLFDGGGQGMLPADRFQLTALGRFDLRALLVAAGVPAPVTSSLARSDARELPAALLSYRAGHPHAGEVLGSLADAVEPLDKAVAKRLRKAAFKAGSAK